MQAYDQAVVSASKVISEAIISDLDCVIASGLGLDDLITDISRRINHQVTQQAMNAASSRLVSLYKQQGWQPLRNSLKPSTGKLPSTHLISAAPDKPAACAPCVSILG